MSTKTRDELQREYEERLVSSYSVAPRRWRELCRILAELAAKQQLPAAPSCTACGHPSHPSAFCAAPVVRDEPTTCGCSGEAQMQPADKPAVEVEAVTTVLEMAQRYSRAPNSTFEMLPSWDGQWIDRNTAIASAIVDQRHARRADAATIATLRARVAELEETLRCAEANAVSVTAHNQSVITHVGEKLARERDTTSRALARVADLEAQLATAVGERDADYNLFVELSKAVVGEVRASVTNAEDTIREARANAQAAKELEELRAKLPGFLDEYVLAHARGTADDTWPGDDADLALIRRLLGLTPKAVER